MELNTPSLVSNAVTELKRHFITSCCWWLIWPIQNDAKNQKKWPKPWHMGTHLRALSESFPMNTNVTGFRWFSKICVIMLALTMLEIYYLQTFFLESIWSRNGDQMPYTNSPSNILWTFALLPSYFQKYESSRLYFPEELEVSIG